MICGIGVDIVEISRIARAMERQGRRFVQRILRETEIRDPLTPTYLAGRFAAKEALVKALGTGFAQAIGFQDLEITATPLGAPRVRLLGAASIRLHALGGTTVHLSISHSQEHAVAMAIIEGNHSQQSG